ncbi:FkbM family methyltransferase [Candidatus Pelagibacter bacterium nBUS_30]|uniref:FkbM family methyltransferase n=1 Tax=Candidatus Pelagibacter bacterium nBUS_30 TaxID=3374191 RepID=UPI003EB90DD5
MHLIKLIRSILNFFDFFQQKKIIKFFKHSLKNDLTLFDVGSHYGETVKLFFNNFKIKDLHCFEASPLNFKILSTNIKKYNLNFNHEINNIGIGSRSHDTFINHTEESSSSTINQFNFDSKYFQKKLKILNIKEINKFYKKIPIKIITLDEYISKKKIRNIDILKIDTEGFELNVIKGLTLNHKIIKFIYFEHHYDDMIRKNYTFSDINFVLKNYGFKKVYKSKMYFRKSFEYIYKNSFI